MSAVFEEGCSFASNNFTFVIFLCFMNGQNFHFKKEDDLVPQNANSINSCTRMLKLSYDVIA